MDTTIPFESTIMPSPQRYFCHACRINFSRNGEIQTCPSCNSDFIEQVSNTMADHHHFMALARFPMQLFQAIMYEENPQNGLTKQQLQNIPDVQVSDDQFNDKTNCVICIVDFKRKEKVKLLPCKHMYHKKCITNWLKSNQTCPVCRTAVNGPKENAQPQAVAEQNANPNVIVIDDDAGDVNDAEEEVGNDHFFIGVHVADEDAPGANFEGFIHFERIRPRVLEANEVVIVPDTPPVSVEDATAEETPNAPNMDMDHMDDEIVPETPVNEIHFDRAQLPREVRNLLHNNELTNAFAADTIDRPRHLRSNPRPRDLTRPRDQYPIRSTPAARSSKDQEAVATATRPNSRARRTPYDRPSETVTSDAMRAQNGRPRRT